MKVLEVAILNGGDEVAAYARVVASATGGDLELRYLSRNETIERFGESGSAIVGAVRTGQVPLAILPAREFSAQGISALDALQAPMVVDSLILEAELFRDDALMKPMRDAVATLGVDVPGILPGPLVHPFGISRHLLVPSDLTGATIAVSPGDVAAQTLRLLGAEPEESQFNGARMNDFDGAMQQLASVTGNSYHAPGRSVTVDVALWPRPLVIIANRDALASLSDGERAALTDATEAAISGILQTNEDMEAEAASIGCGAGLELVRAGDTALGEWRRSVQPLVDQVAAASEAAAAFIGRAEELRPTSPVAVPVCPAPPGEWPTEVSAALDGTYTADMTADDLRAGGVPEMDVVPENWGHWVLVVKEGRYALTQESPDACTWAFGKWRMSDDLVRTTVEAGGGIAPNGAIAKPGEDFVYDWTDFGGVLTLTLAMDEGPFDMAYTRISGTPDSTAFPARCAPPAAAFAAN